MTATPYDCLRIIESKEAKYEKQISGVLYHSKRNYSYLDTKYFANEKTELAGIITDSVVNNGERWLVFIDSKKKCSDFKKHLEYSDGEPTALEGKVMAVNADSKYNDEEYQKMIVSENFPKGIFVVITTSVIDNGVNFRNVGNVVITDTDRTKSLQMVGRLRVGRDPATKAPFGKVTAYIKRHNANHIARRLQHIRAQQDAYHDYDMSDEGRHFKWKFLDKYKDGDQEEWENSKHWFGRSKDDPDKLYFNGIAKELADKNETTYESILDEMEKNDPGRKVTGQEYLEYQLSWFGKTYSEENDITLNGHKNNGQIGFENWIRDELMGKTIPKSESKDFGKMFFEKYNPVYGLCSKKQGFSSDDNRGENGPKNAGYSVKRISEIFQVRKMPFSIVEETDAFQILGGD
jgi:hypothetical protein